MVAQGFFSLDDDLKHVVHANARGAWDDGEYPLICMQGVDYYYVLYFTNGLCEKGTSGETQARRGVELHRAYGSVNGR